MSKLKVQLDAIATQLGSWDGLKNAAQFVQSAARLKCPVLDGALRSSIYIDYYNEHGAATAEIYTTMQYAPYVEFGTGPKGAANHAGISPEVTPTYRMDAWWIHEDDLPPSAKATYNWFVIDTPNGRFYRSSGQAAQPFLYPALKDNEDVVMDILKDKYKEAFK